MTFLRRWVLAIVAALTIGAAAGSCASAAPLGGLSQAASSVQIDAAPTAEPVYYYYRRYRVYRPYYRVYRPYRVYRRYYRVY